MCSWLSKLQLLRGFSADVGGSAAAAISQLKAAPAALNPGHSVIVSECHFTPMRPLPLTTVALCSPLKHFFFGNIYWKGERASCSEAGVKAKG